MVALQCRTKQNTFVSSADAAVDAVVGVACIRAAVVADSDVVATAAGNP